MSSWFTSEVISMSCVIRHLDVRIDVPHHVIVVLGVVEDVHVDDPADLLGVGMWVLPVNTLRPYFGVLTIKAVSPWFQ